MSKLDQNKTPLFSVLKNEYAGRNMLPFHVPGHKSCLLYTSPSPRD